MDHIASFAHYLQNEEGRSPLTVSGYVADVRQLRAWLDEQGGRGLPPQWEEVTAAMVRSHLASRTLAPRRTHRVLASWRKFFRFLREVQELGGIGDPISTIKRPKVAKRLPQTLSTAEVAKLLNVARDQPNSGRALRDWALIAFLFGTGTRISEALNLEFEKIQYQDGAPVAVKVVGKGDKERSVPLSPTAARALTHWLKERKSRGHPMSTFVFSYISGPKSGQPFPVRTIQDMMHTHGKAAGIPPERCTPHKLRHSFGTALAEAGHGLDAIKDLLGHESVATTQIYIHASQKRLTAATASLPDVLDITTSRPLRPKPTFKKKSA